MDTLKDIFPSEQGFDLLLINKLISDYETKSVTKGKLQIIIGPMFSGKSTELLRRINRYTIGKKKCIVIKYDQDKRYSDLKMSTHDQAMWDAIPVNTLMDAKTQCLDKEISVVGIDEAQFFPDLLDFCNLLLNHGKIVIAAGLNGTYQQKPFGKLLDLVPMADEILKLVAVCTLCGEDASFTKKKPDPSIAWQRYEDNDQQIEIGGSNLYIAVCRNCL